jgi:ATP-dependent helicase/nuclease subunit A
MLIKSNAMKSTTTPSSPTPQQKAASAARGNVLVSAGAGAGKTRTLVDRCLNWLLDQENPGSIDQILMVTFTEAAAAEMRQRLRARIESVQAVEHSQHLAEQLALLDTAWICTLHSFCFTLVREHFYSLGLDPQTIVLPDERAKLLARQALDSVLQQNYASETPAARAIQDAIQSLGGDSDSAARALVMRLHHYSQTLPDPDAWFEAQITGFQQSSSDRWREWLMQALETCRQSWLLLLRAEQKDNPCAQRCLDVVNGLPAKPTRAEFAAALDALCSAETEFKPKQRKPLEGLFSEAVFLRSVCAEKNGDPLAQDWNWSAPSMLALLDLTRQFGEAYRLAKRDAAGLDFHDLEQFALRLLREAHTGQASAIALRWRQRLRLVFVDEFQDINGAQDAIIQALGGEDAQGTRFLVGDIKQSIYRFRLADPRIFLKYQREWETQSGAGVLALTENFRSQAGILDFVNAFFGAVMRPELGGLTYDENAYLHPGLGAGAPLSAPCVELLLRVTGRTGAEDSGSENSDGEQLSATAIEARLVGRRLLELKNQPVSLPGQPPRPATWADMVILLRSPRHKAENYVKEFARLGIPLDATRGGFYETPEVRDLLSLLQILDNPSQDVPLLGVLRSPLVGLTADELASIRLAQRPGHFWTALLRWTQANPAHARTAAFLTRFRSWRHLSRMVGISQLLETIVAESSFSEIVSAQPGASANVSRLIYLTRQYDSFRGEGLYRFLQFIEVQRENEIETEPAARPARDSVRLMSIHQSKGLEFPIVALPDLGKRFNLDDTRGRVILDEEFGLCPQVKPPGHYQFYPSLPHWLAQRRQRRETYGEEMRLLYVAMTRAAGHLILCGSARESTMEGKWTTAAARGLGIPEILAANSVLDWLGTWLLGQSGAEALSASGGNSLLAWKIINDSDCLTLPEQEAALPASPEADLEVLRQTRPLAEWCYPFSDATRRAAKTTVTALRRLREEDDDESELFFGPRARTSHPGPSRSLSAADVGSAHHTFLESVALDATGSVAQLEVEAARLQREGILSEAEVGSLDLTALARYWQSALGREIVKHRAQVRRELPFTARFSPAEIAHGAGGAPSAADIAGEFVIVQGVIDLAVFLPGEIWLLDFKTDHFAPDELDAKVAEYRLQLDLYARALARIYRLPVTRRWLHFLRHGETVEP